MQSRAEVLRSLGESLDRYAPHRVARLGCGAGAALALLAVAGGFAGLIPADPIFPGFLRILILTVLSGVLLVFAICAALETSAERRAGRELASYLASGEADLATLLEMARARRGRFPGSERVIELLEKASGRPLTSA